MRMMGLLSGFASDARGGIATTMAIMILPLILLVGLSIDSARAYLGQSRLSYAVDSATLAGGRAYVEAYALPPGQRDAVVADAVAAYFAANYVRDFLGADGQARAKVDSDDGTILSVSATADVPTTFMRLAGMTHVPIAAKSSIRRDIATQEVVLTLDNTGSMYESCNSAATCSESRMERMRMAAKGLVNALFDAQRQRGLLRVGVVPFITSVNIRAEQPLSADAGTASPPGYGLPPPNPVDDRVRYLVDASGRRYTSAALQAEYAPVAWRGCIIAQDDEGLVSGEHRIDTVSDAVPRQGMNWVPFHYPSTFASDFGVEQRFATPPPLSNLITLADRRVLPRCHGIGDNDYVGATELAAYPQCVDDVAARTVVPTGGVCVSDPVEPVYKGTAAAPACPARIAPTRLSATYGVAADPRGPNLTCPVPMLGLSGNRKQVLRKLDEMTGQGGRGGTMNDVAMLWALRMLSPRAEWKDFFGTQGLNYPFDWRARGNQKIAIFLTDGQNEAHNNARDRQTVLNGLVSPASFPDTSDYTYYGRAGTARLPGSEVLDPLMLAACTAMKSAPYNVTTYAILVDVPDPRVQDLFRQCASTPDKFYNISGDELGEAFSHIAASLTNLRLTN